MPAKQKVDRDELATLTSEGWTSEQLAERYNVHPTSIRRLRGKLGISQQKTMTEERRAKIAAMIEDGWSFAEISRTEGADRVTLQRHFPGKQWTQEQRVEYQAALREASPYYFNQRRDRWRKAA